MTIAFDTTQGGQKSLEAALHPKDKTCRPQIVSYKTNPDYYALIKTFGDLTGVYGVLNTSFNLHGFPIVDSPSDALHVFENSELDALQMETYLIEKKL
jgi:carbamoyltransferase